ncbi:MAG: MFS transporter [bacterium]
MFFSLLRNKNFMRLWVTQTLSQLEATIVDFSIALVFASAAVGALDIAGSQVQFGQSATAIVFALQFLPALPASLAAGLISDIFDRRTLIIGLNIFRAVFLMIFFFAAHTGTHLYIFVFIMAICMHMYDVIEKATLRNVTPEKELGMATGLFLFTMNATTLIGVVAAGFLVKAVGLQAIFLSGSILFALASIASFKLPKNINNFYIDHYEQNTNVLVDTQRAVTSLFVSLKESFHYFLTVPPVWMSVILVTIVQTVTLMIASVSFIYGKDVLNSSMEQVSIYLLIPIATGLAMGGAFTAVITKKFSYRKVVMSSWFMSSILLFIFGGIGFVATNLKPGISFEFIVFIILIVVLGFFVTMVQSPALELIQRFANPQMRGKIFGILVGATYTISGLLVGFSSILVDLLGSQKFIIFISIILFICMFIFNKIVRKVLGKKDFIDYSIEDKSINNLNSQQ